MTFTGSGYQWGSSARTTTAYQGISGIYLLYGNVVGSSNADGVLMLCQLTTSVKIFASWITSNGATGSLGTSQTLTDIGTVTVL